MCELVVDNQDLVPSPPEHSRQHRESQVRGYTLALLTLRIKELHAFLAYVHVDCTSRSCRIPFDTRTDSPIEGVMTDTGKNSFLLFERASIHQPCPRRIDDPGNLWKRNLENRKLTTRDEKPFSWATAFELESNWSKKPSRQIQVRNA